MSSGLVWFILVMHVAFALPSIIPTLFDDDALEAQNMKSDCYQDPRLGDAPNTFDDKAALDTYTTDNAAWLQKYDAAPSHFVRTGTSYRRSGGSWVTTDESTRVKRWANVPDWFCATPLASFLDALATLKDAFSFNPIDIITNTISGMAKLVKALVIDLGTMNYAILRHDGDVLGTISILVRFGVPLLVVATSSAMWLKKG